MPRGDPESGGSAKTKLRFNFAGICSGVVKNGTYKLRRVAGCIVDYRFYCALTTVGVCCCGDGCALEVFRARGFFGGPCLTLPFLSGALCETKGVTTASGKVARRRRSHK